MKFLKSILTTCILLIVMFNAEAQTHTTQTFDNNKALIRKDFYYNDSIVRAVFYESDSIIKSDYHIVGSTKVMSIYKNGVLYASSTTNTETGEVVGISYNKDGYIIGVYHSKDKKLHGKRYSYYSDGSLKHIREYDNGNLLWEEEFLPSSNKIDQ